MSNEKLPTIRQSTQVDLSPQTFDQALTFSKYLADSDMVPKDFKGKPGNCLIAMQWGAELGLKPLQSLQNLAVINGRPALWGDAVIALVLSSPVCEYVEEEDDGHTATCRVKRKGAASAQVRTFSMDDARHAGLAGKQGPWTQYPKRMRQMRARAFALRDVFADVLRGMGVVEELQDMDGDQQEEHRPDAKTEPKNMGPVDVVLPDYDAKKWAHNLPNWVKAVAEGGKTIEDLLNWLRAKATISEEQEKELRDKVKAAYSVAAAGPNPEELQKQFAECNDLDTLYGLGSQIDQVTDPSHQATLTDAFDARVAELEKQ